MATLSERLSSLATAVSNHIRDSIAPRTLPAGGSAGQVLTKSSATDYAAAWQTPSGGGVSGVLTITVPATMGGSFGHVEMVSVPGVTATQRVHLSIATHLDTDENSHEMLDVLALAGTPSTDAIEVTAAFASRTSGPIKLNYMVG